MRGGCEVPSDERTAMYSNIPEDALCCAYLRKSREDEERERTEKATRWSATER